jgi:hypothetical protein
VQIPVGKLTVEYSLTTFPLSHKSLLIVEASKADLEETIEAIISKNFQVIDAHSMIVLHRDHGVWRAVDFILKPAEYREHPMDFLKNVFVRSETL